MKAYIWLNLFTGTGGGCINKPQSIKQFDCFGVFKRATRVLLKIILMDN